MNAPLTTSPSSALPAAARKRAKDEKPFGAGLMMVTEDGRALFLKRSAQSDEPETWCFPGGMIEGGETAQAAADREASEETGYRSPEGADASAQEDEVDGFVTYARSVADPFVPELNDEHTAYAWAKLDEPPAPLHPGVAELLKRRARRMAKDHAIVFAMDAESVRTKDSDGRLRIKVARISKADVNPYLGKEIPGSEDLGLDDDKIYHLLRDPAELEKAAHTSNLIQILDEHDPVEADDAKEEIVAGATGTDAAFDGEYLTNSLGIWTKRAIDGIEDDSRRQLSCGYRYRVEMTPGVFNGKHYDGIMRDLVFNHVALVKKGRAGPEVMVGDSMENLMSKPTRFQNLCLQVTAAVVKPRMAKDAALDLGSVFAGVTQKNFKADRPKIARSLAEHLKGKTRMAKDASVESLEKLLDVIECGAEGADESVSEAQHGAMEAAAHGNSNLGIPESVGKEFVAKDAAGVRGMLEQRGLAGDDLDTVMDSIEGLLKGKKEGEDADLDEEEKKAEDEKSEEEEKKAQDEKEEDDAEAEDEDKTETKEKPVDKKAMDAALSAASAATEARVKKAFRETREAENFVRPYVGDMNGMAFDSAEQVLRHAAKMLNVEGADSIHASALKTVIGMLPKAGEVRRRDEERAEMAMDEATVSQIDKIAPGLARIERVA